MLFITGDQAHSREFCEQAYQLAAELKQLVLVSRRRYEVATSPVNLRCISTTTAVTAAGSGRAAFTLTDEWTSAMPIRSLSGKRVSDQDRSLMSKDRDKPNDPGAPFTSANGVRFGGRGTDAVDVDRRRDGGPGG
jgi:hypothetical protein